MTNAEKFNEVFGFIPYEKQPPFDCYECPLDCAECEKWWAFEFKKVTPFPEKNRAIDKKIWERVESEDV